MYTVQKETKDLRVQVIFPKSPRQQTLTQVCLIQETVLRIPVQWLKLNLQTYIEAVFLSPKFSNVYKMNFKNFTKWQKLTLT